MGLRKAKEVATLHPVAARDYPRDIEGLRTQLTDGDPAVRRWAARDLADSPEAVDALGRRLSQEADPSVREALFTALCSIGGAAAVDALLPLLRSEDAGLRNGAIEALAMLPDGVGQRIDALLRDPDADVRIFTVNLLGQLRHARIGQWLGRVLIEEPAVNVVAAALEVLVEVGGPEHRPMLDATAARYADDPFIGFAIDLARSRIEAT